jgi:hypothetical protein
MTVYAQLHKSLMWATHVFHTLDDACFRDYLRKGIGHSPKTELREEARQLAQNIEALMREVRFNPYHDPENGQFTFAPRNAGSENWPERGESSLDVDKAVKHLNDNATTFNHALKRFNRPIGNCALYVRRALEAGGVFIKNYPGLAKEYGPYLEKAGFHKLSPRPQPDYDAQKGDVVVIQNYEPRKAGHIAIFNGRDWVSDFVPPQRGSIWAGPGYRQYKPPYEVYRP